MAANKKTSALVDTILRIVIGGGFIAVGLSAPQLLQALDKPTHKLLGKLDAREKKRKLQNTIRYMRQSGLLVGDYEHGITVSQKARHRLAKRDFDSIAIHTPIAWDGKWRLVFFDIPETARENRRLLTSKLRHLGYQPLQLSIWIHPFASKDVIAHICNEFEIAKYVTYVETTHIDHQDKLKARFKPILNTQMK